LTPPLRALTAIGSSRTTSFVSIIVAVDASSEYSLLCAQRDAIPSNLWFEPPFLRTRAEPGYRAGGRHSVRAAKGSLATRPNVPHASAHSKWPGSESSKVSAHAMFGLFADHVGPALWCERMCLALEEATSLPLDALSRAQSQSPVAAIARHVFPLECGGSLHAQIRLLVCSAIFPVLRLAAPFQRLLLPAFFTSTNYRYSLCLFGQE